jgi:hypothetical protein
MGGMTIRLAQTVSVSSSGAGTVAALIYSDPFSASFTEYTSDLANIFAQFRLLAVRIQMVSTIETKGDTSVMAVAYQNRNTGLGTPSSVNTVIDNAGSRLWAVSNDTTNSGLWMRQRINVLNFAATSTSANTSTDAAGAPGGWQMFGSGFPVSTVIAYCMQECWYQFRSRS